MPRPELPRTAEVAQPTVKGAFGGGIQDAQPRLRSGVASPATEAPRAAMPAAVVRQESAARTAAPALTAEQKASMLRAEYFRRGGRDLVSDVEIGPDGKPVFYVSLICCTTPENHQQAVDRVLWYLQPPKENSKR